MAVAAGQRRPPDRIAVVVAADVTASTTGGCEDVAEGDPGARRQVIAPVDVLRCTGDGRAVASRTGMARVAAVAERSMFGVAVGLGAAVSVGRGKAVAVAARDGACSPDRRGVGRDGSGGNRGAVGVAEGIGTVVVAAAGHRAVVVGPVAEVRVEGDVDHAVDVLRK